jgi:Zn-dependent peptidase ImmA (M78 family)
MSEKIRVNIKKSILVWARERSGIDQVVLETKFPALAEWEKGEKKPTLIQLEKFADVTRTPLGYLFLENPPKEELPIPLYRTPKNKPILRPSPDLMETVETMQLRQEWMTGYLIEEKQDVLPFVGSVDINTDPILVSESIRNVLKLKKDWAQQHAYWAAASYALREAIDNAGILVTRNGVVGNNNWRKLNVDEFRGFVLIGQYAPLIFINGADYEGAQLFTIAHELAHVWLGTGSAFNLLNLQPFDNATEQFCDKVAAEFLVPRSELQAAWRDVEKSDDRFDLLARRFKVSSIVAARRALDLQFISRDNYFEFYRKYKDDQDERLASMLEKLKRSKKQGVNFYNTQNVRIGKRFASAIYHATQEGRILYRDAFRLTGLYGNTFDNYFKRVGIA